MSADDWAGRRAVVMGLGAFGGGVAAARYLARRGARVTVTDLRSAEVLDRSVRALDDLDVTFVLGRHEDRDFANADLVVVNPAVPPSAAPIRVAREAGARITSEVALFLDAVRAPVVAITGTQGKSSTCRYLADLAAADGRRVHLGGNIGRALLAEVDEIDADELVVLEVSSYQLETLPDAWTRDRADSPIRCGVFTNITSDHLERHGSRADYVAAKLRLMDLLAPGATAIVPADADWIADAAARRDDVAIVRFATASGGDGADLVRDARGYRRGDEVLAPADARDDLPDFQRANLLAALGAARIAGTPSAALARAARETRGLPHRMARLGTIGGREVVDNAVSTTPETTLSALRALPAGSTVLLGGHVKALDTGELFAALAERRDRVVVFGEAAARWTEDLRAAGADAHPTGDVPSAVRAAFELTPAGGTILFSPACSSFDAYPNFQARADDFHAALRR